MKQLYLEPISKISGEITLPGSKSLSNRALLLAALSNEICTITNLLDSDDVRYMLKALSQLGVSYNLLDNNKTCILQGVGGNFNIEDNLELFLGNAGTAMRPLCATLCLSKTRKSIILTGEPRMKERPIKDLVIGLQGLGATVSYLENEGYPPLKISSNGLKGGKICISGAISSQFLTALLMIAPLCNEKVTIEIIDELVSKPYVDITIKMMADFGVKVEHSNYKTFTIEPQKYQAPAHYSIEGDASSASYFLAAAAIKGEVKVYGIGKNSIQGDRLFVDVLAQMGADIEYGDDWISCKRNQLQAVDVDLNHIPDAAMTVAVLALFAKGKTTIRGIANWKVKETDRLNAMATELRKVGAKVEVGDDFISIEGLNISDFKEVSIETYNDHRMAMCFSLIAFSNVGVTILEPDCTSKTYPNYFNDLQSLY